MKIVISYIYKLIKTPQIRENMNYYSIHQIDPDCLREQFRKYMNLMDKTHYQIAQEIKIDRTTLVGFDMHPETVHYRTANKIHQWIKKHEARIYGQGSL